MKNKTKLLATLLGLKAIALAYAGGDNYSNYGCVPQLDFGNCGVPVETCRCETQKLTITGLLQTNYQFMHVQDKAPEAQILNKPKDVNNFLVRRARLGFEADLPECWRGVLVMDFANRYATTSSQSGDRSGLGAITENSVYTNDNKNGQFGLHSAFIEKSFNNIVLRAGYKKVRFGYEEIIKDQCLKTIERSIVTNFFENDMTADPRSGGGLAFSGRHVGVYADVCYGNFTGGAAIVNGFQGNNFSSLRNNNELGFYGYAAYINNCNGFDFEIGCNVGYQGKGNNTTLSSFTPPRRGSIFGWNPYAKFTWNNFYAMGELIGAKIERGAVDGSADARPLGGNLILSYTWNCFELVGRFSGINTGRRGMLISTGILGCSDTTDNNASPADIYNKAITFYGGINYYMLKGAVKLSAGYEFAKFRNRHSGLLASGSGLENPILSPNGFTESYTTPTIPIEVQGNYKSQIHSVRVQLQLLF